MRFINPRYALEMEQGNGTWCELTGPFPTLQRAEQWLDSPPDDLGDPGTVTILQRIDGAWGVFTLEEKPDATGVTEIGTGLADRRKRGRKPLSHARGYKAA